MAPKDRHVTTPLPGRQASRSAAVKARLDHPVIDTDVHVDDHAPALEDCVQHHGGGLADALRKSGCRLLGAVPRRRAGPAAAGDEFRQPLQRAINHFHADLHRKQAHRLTPVAGISQNTPQEGIEELEFAIGTPGLNVVNIAGGGRRPIPALAAEHPKAEHPEVTRHAGYADLCGIDGPHDHDPFWTRRDARA